MAGRNCPVWHYVTPMLLQCIIFTMKASVSSNNGSMFFYLQLGEDNSYLYIINKHLIRAEYYFEVLNLL